MLKEVFNRALDAFLQKDNILFDRGLHEQTLVARLGYHLQYFVDREYSLRRYFVDVEYNRAHGGVRKQMRGGSHVFVDLVVHGRGLLGHRENILCLEMKKRHSARPWRNSVHAAESIFPLPDRPCGTKNDRQIILADQRRLIEFTTKGNANNMAGYVQGYELGILFVPRYTHRTGSVEQTRISQIFIRYYKNGDFSTEDDCVLSVGSVSRRF